MLFRYRVVDRLVKVFTWLYIASVLYSDFYGERENRVCCAKRMRRRVRYHHRYCRHRGGGRDSKKYKRRDDKMPSLHAAAAVICCSVTGDADQWPSRIICEIIIFFGMLVLNQPAHGGRHWVRSLTVGLLYTGGVAWVAVPRRFQSHLDVKSFRSPAARQRRSRILNMMDKSCWTYAATSCREIV